jgi:recombination protein RecA
MAKEKIEVLDKEKARKEALAAIQKKHGKNSIMLSGDYDLGNIEVIPTGSIGLNLALGVGGYPKGRIIEIYGENSCGKSVMSLQAIAECQKQGGTCALIDSECCYLEKYSKGLGVDTNALYVSQPDSGEQAFEIIEELVKSNSFDLIVVDSVSALIPTSEAEAEMAASSMGSQARLMSKGLKNIINSVSKSKTVLFFINQTRKTFAMYGPKSTTSGGEALKFYASVRMEIKKGKPIMDGDIAIGSPVTIKVVKNKVAPPFRETTFDIIYAKGVDRIGELFDFGLTMKFIEKSGPWFYYNGEKIAQGKEAAIEYLKSNTDLINTLEKNVYEYFSKTNNNITTSRQVVIDEDGVVQDGT